MNNYDLLLHWMSARPKGEVSTAMATEACAALAQNGSQATETGLQDSPKVLWRHRFLGALHRLGHVEMVGQQRWAVLPPTVIWMSGKCDKGTAHLYGARSLALWQQLSNSFGDQLQRITQNHGPELWAFIGEHEGAQALSYELGSDLYMERGLDLLASLPPLSEVIQQIRTEVQQPRLGRGWEYADVSFHPRYGPSFRWRSLDRSQGLSEGLFRTSEGYPRVWIHASRLSGGRDLQIRRLDERNLEHGLIARWFEIARQGRLRLIYHAKTQELAIPHVYVPLPIMIDRALHTASGTCPKLIKVDDRRYWFYPRISRQRARLVGKVLGTQLEMVNG